MADSTWSQILASWFAEIDPDAIRDDWNLLKQRIAVGQRVTGTVVAKAPFGAWIDVGGFPGLLEIICIKGLTPEQYRAGEWCPVGTEVSAFVGGFRDDEHQISLYQVKPGENHEGHKAPSGS